VFEVRRRNDHSDIQDLTDIQDLFFSIIAYNLSLTLSKLSILLLYLTFFVFRRDRIACFIVIGFVMLYGIYLFVSNVFGCTPVDYFWNKSDPMGRCIQPKVLWLINAGTNIFTDFVIILLPMPLIFGLQMPVRQKIGLIFIFTAGLL
jgi:hypothetical protein